MNNKHTITQKDTKRHTTQTKLIQKYDEDGGSRGTDEPNDLASCSIVSVDASLHHNKTRKSNCCLDVSALFWARFATWHGKVGCLVASVQPALAWGSLTPGS